MPPFLASRPTSPAAVPVPPLARLGRFELRQELGRGAQATVWLAWDPTLEREVALKVLADNADPLLLRSCLDEARVMGAINHPGIVNVYEVVQAMDAASQRQKTALVLELVRGPTLTERMRTGPRYAVREAVTLVREVLDALHAAHQSGVVHRDLKPSNVLLGPDGRSRVMDFGIAARPKAGHAGEVVGTPGYISPEAAAGLPPTPQMDVFAAGMLLGCLLAGAPLLRESDPLRALQRVQTEDLAWPEGGANVDDRLREVVLRAVARQPAARWADAAEFRQALDDWLNPPATTGHAHGTLDFLLRRMRLTGDFPALSESVLKIQRVTASERESLQSLSAEILRDVALTQKLLRMANTAHFRYGGRGEVTTVSRAVALVGFAGIRNMAMSLVLLEHMKDRGQAQRMRELFVQALLTATLTDQLTPPSREREEAFLAGMMCHLGRMLTEYYFPEEAERIRHRARSVGDPFDDHAAVLEVLGLGLDDLAQGVAQSWGLPDSLRLAMLRPDGDLPNRRIEAPAERMRWRIRAAAELARDLMLTPKDQASSRIVAQAERYALPLDLPPDDMVDAVGVARRHLAELARTLQLDLAPQALARRLLAAESTSDAANQRLDRPQDSAAPQEATLRLPSRAPAMAPAEASSAPPSAGPSPRATPVAGRAAPAAAGAVPAVAHEVLNHGISAVTSTLAGDAFKLNDVLHTILDTMHRGVHFRRVVFCLRDPRSGLLTGRLGLGDGGADLSRRFSLDARTATPADLFAAACIKGADTLVADAHARDLLSRLPPWYRDAAARGFLLLPMVMKQVPFALIYADRDSCLDLAEHELGLLRTLRNQAVMAFKSAG